MPAKNSRKLYSPTSYYHVYNRGVEKRNIFQDKQDYGVFLSYLKEYLLPKNEKELLDKLANSTDPQEKDKALRALRMNNFSDTVKLISYCLMPNHYHLLLYQKSEDAMDNFMNSFGSRYTRYFNKKHKRVGTLYQDVYKAVHVTTDEQLLHLTRYIHRNPFSLLSKDLVLQGEVLQASPNVFFRQPSSYPEYLGKRKSSWVHPGDILTHFSKTNSRLSYKSFVMEQETIEVIQDVAIDI